ncbi:hypothetical protein ACMD2_15966 [Ananas comosus]|uniref:Transposase-associated domain-containing protein n=1 Tax=Ananas comosus TaxID=4615 RepID=A0A199VTD2_ANACO|nr:hypothetical protein ACMD2_15966 [Ananas comosus]
MGIDKSWMSLRNRACNEYEKGIDIFLDFAFKRLGNVKRIRCPCAKCYNVRLKSRTEVKYDLFCNGIIQSYTKWHHHGELSDESSSETKKKGRGPTTNPNTKKRKEEKKGKVEFSKRLGRAVGGLQLAEFITEMGVVWRQYAPLNVYKWAEGPMPYKDKMWDDLMEKYDGLAGFRDEVMYNFNHMYRDWRHRKHLHYNQFLTDEERLQNCPDDIIESDWASLVEYFGSVPFKKQFEHVRKSQEELGDPPLSTEEHLTKAFGARSGYFRGLGCGPKPPSSKNLEAKASKEAIE